MDSQAIVRLLSSTLQLRVRFLERPPALKIPAVRTQSVLGTRTTMEIFA